VVAGIVADDIRSVTLVDASTTSNLPIVNNAFYTELNEPNTKAFTVKLIFGYANGSTSEASLESGGPMRLP
jgi:hypothetical protein